MLSIRNIFKSDGTFHQEQQVDNLRIDLMTGQTSTVIGQPGGIQTVIGPNGQTHFEQQLGNTRFNMSTGGTDQLF